MRDRIIRGAVPKDGLIITSHPGEECAHPSGSAAQASFPTLHPHPAPGPDLGPPLGSAQPAGWEGRGLQMQLSSIFPPQCFQKDLENLPFPEGSVAPVQG